MTTHQHRSLRINRADKIASKQSGLPSLFYTIKRCYRDDEASSYLRAYPSPSAQPAVVESTLGLKHSLKIKTRSRRNDKALPLSARFVEAGIQ